MKGFTYFKIKVFFPPHCLNEAKKQAGVLRMGSKMGCVGQEGKRLSSEQLLLLFGQRTKFSFKHLFTGQLSHLYFCLLLYFFLIKHLEKLCMSNPCS